jgi:kumamolisin
MSPFYRSRCIAGWRAIAALLVLILVLIPLTSCTGASDGLQSTPLDLGLPDKAKNSPVVGSLPDKTKLQVRITFKLNPEWLKRVEQRKVEPGKPSRLDQVAQQLGIDDATYQKIKEFFSPQGISLKLSKLRTHLAVDASAGTMARLLQTKFVIHKYNGRTFYAPATPPKVPEFLANSVEAITGLSNFSAPPVHAMRPLVGAIKSSPLRPEQDCEPDSRTLYPREVAGAYGFDKLWQRGLNGENMTVNLVEIDGSYQDDIQNYFDCIQFRGHLAVKNVGGEPRIAAGESTLDIQMIAGLARSININLYQTDLQDEGSVWVQVNDMLQQIIDDNVDKANAGSVVSISLGASEDEISQEDIRAIDSSFQQLTRIERMTVFVASGDCGAFNSGDYGRLSVSFPASSPWATAVGGTILSVDEGRSRVGEVVWSDDSSASCKNRWGSGGGNSQVFKRPHWQDALGVNNRYSRGNRQLPDVSAVGYGLAVYFKGEWGAVGGTSASAPIWATGLALVNQGLMKQVHKFAYSPQVFYEVAKRSAGVRPYYDVTRGDNLYYPATSGWDYATGLGTPNLPDFYTSVSRIL